MTFLATLVLAVTRSASSSSVCAISPQGDCALTSLSTTENTKEVLTPVQGVFHALSACTRRSLLTKNFKLYYY